MGCVEEQSTEGNIEELSPQVNVEKPSLENNVEKPEPGEQKSNELFITYSDNIPSSVYNLYPKLDNYLLSYKITNDDADTLEVTVSSEITGYTDEAINKKYISSGETIEILQTPLFKPGVLDSLNEKKMRIYTLKSHVLRVMLKNSGTSKQNP